MEHSTRKQARLISATPILHVSAALATTHREAVPGVQGAHQAGVRHSVSDCSERQKLRGTATGPLYPRSGTRPQATPIRGRGLGHRSHLSAVGDCFGQLSTPIRGRGLGHTYPRSGTRPQATPISGRASASGHSQLGRPSRAVVRAVQFAGNFGQSSWSGRSRLSYRTRGGAETASPSTRLETGPSGFVVTGSPHHTLHLLQPLLSPPQVQVHIAHSSDPPPSLAERPPRRPSPPPTRSA